MTAALCFVWMIAGQNLIAQEKPEKATQDTVHGKGLVEIVFVIDTTGSMGGLIEAAKSKVWSIVNEVSRSPTRPKVKVGLVAYRDLGDSYVTKITPISSDLDTIYTTLMNFKAEGGGDTPENVRQALLDGVRKAGWSAKEAHTAQILFLVGDAPPHEDYKNLPSCQTTAGEAVKKGLIVNAIECGEDPIAKAAWQEIARLGEGQFFAIEQNGGVKEIATPYDSKLSKLSYQIGSSYSAYGRKAYRASQGGSQMATEFKVRSEASGGAQADRALNKALNRDAYKDDLVQDVTNGTVNLKSVKKEELPDDLQKLSPEALVNEVSKRAKNRKELTTKILELTQKRDTFLKEAKKQQGGSKNGFDDVVSQALKKQIARKGVRM